MGIQGTSGKEKWGNFLPQQSIGTLLTDIDAAFAKLVRHLVLASFSYNSAPIKLILC